MNRKLSHRENGFHGRRKGKQYREDNKDKLQQYYEDNKSKILKQKHQ